MNEYINVYNNLINLTRNKQLYLNLKRNDVFSDRLILFLLHFSFFIKNFKDKESKKILQKIYDFNFRQLELSIREIGYGDQTINKKMKIYINLFHEILSEVHFWNTFDINKKNEFLGKYLNDYEDLMHIVKYFDDFHVNLSKKTLNYFIKSVINR